MRQVPYYLIIGNGRLARHFKHYLSLLNLPHDTWHRALPLTSLHKKMRTATHCLLLINDHAIEAFVRDHMQQTALLLVHCSGSLVSKTIYGAHPLSTFSKDTVYGLERYQAIPFIIDHDAPPFESLLPGLPNPHKHLHKALKEKYHALCVLASNFSCLLWQKLFSDFEKELNLPASMAHPFLKQQMENLIAHPQSALTGPLTRQDTETLEKNLRALEGDPFQLVYKSFISCFKAIQSKESSI